MIPVTSKNALIKIPTPILKTETTNKKSFDLFLLTFERVLMQIKKNTTKKDTALINPNIPFSAINSKKKL